MERGGFKNVRNRSSKKGPDIIADLEGNKILFQCKKAERYGKRFVGIEDLRDQYRTLLRDHSARTAVFVLSDYQLPNFVYDPGFQRKWIRKYHVAIWGNTQIEYYKGLISSLGEWSRYQILNDFEIKKRGVKRIVTSGIRIEQPGGESYLFKIAPSQLLPISYVFRRAYSTDAYQRMLSRKRLRGEIAPFLKSKDSLLPTNLVCVFENGLKYNERTHSLRIPDQYGSAWIIDGQHRLYGFCHVGSPVLDEYELVCTGFDGKKAPMKDISAQGEVFVDINQTAKRIPASLMLNLYEMIGRRDVRVEVVKLLSERKLFKNKIRFNSGEIGNIDFASFVQTPPMRALFDNKSGLVKKYYPASGLDAFRDKSFKSLLGFFQSVRKVFKSKWDRSSTYDLATNKGVRTLLRLLQDVVEHENKAPDKINFSPYLKALRGVELRQSKLKGKYAGEGGADQLSDEWAKHIQIKMPAFLVKGRGVIEQKTFYAGHRKEAEEFVTKWLKQLQGEVYGELTYVDPSTFGYLKSLLGHCSSLRLKVGVVKDEKKCAKAAQSLELGRLRVEVKMIQQKGPMDTAPSPAIHQRWLAGANYEIDFGHDLKRSALGAKDHTVQVFENLPSSRSERYDNLKASWGQLGAMGKETTIRNVYPPDV